MRILRKECRKILNPRLLLIIAIFSFLYYQIFLQITSYQPSATLPVIRQLLDETGGTLTGDDLELLGEKWEAILAKLNPLLAANEVLAAAGADNYERMCACYEELYQKTDLTDAENLIYLEIFHIMTGSAEKGDAAAYYSQIEYLDTAISKLQNPFWFNVPAEEAAQLVETADAGATSLFQKAETLFCQREMSLLPLDDVMYKIVWHDMRYIAILLVLNCLILLVPWQIQERRHEVLSLYASTRTGRGIFGKQFLAGFLCCGVVCALQLLLYLACFAFSGLLLFAKCPAWTDTVNMLWLPVSFGLYLTIYLFMIWLFALGCTVAAYCIGRCAASYVSGIALSIPIGGLLCVFARYLFNSLFFFSLGVRVPLWEAFALTAWLILTGSVLTLFLRRDHRRAL